MRGLETPLLGETLNSHPRGEGRGCEENCSMNIECFIQTKASLMKYLSRVFGEGKSESQKSRVFSRARFRRRFPKCPLPLGLGVSQVRIIRRPPDPRIAGPVASARQTSCPVACKTACSENKAIKIFVHHNHHYHFHTPNCFAASCLQLL